jgi:amino acid permease
MGYIDVIVVINMMLGTGFNTLPFNANGTGMMFCLILFPSLAILSHRAALLIIKLTDE